MKQKLMLSVVSAGIMATMSFSSYAKPSKTECIAPAGAGGGWDLTCRIPAAQVMANLNLVDGGMKVTNMSGAGGGTAYAYVVNERSTDGNLIVAASSSTITRLAQNQYVGLKASDVRWLGAVATDYGVIAVGADSPYKSLGDLIEAVKKNPSKTAIVGASAKGGWDHLKFLMVARAAKISDLKSINYIAFDNGGKALLEIISGRAAAFTGDISELLAQEEAGKVRILAVLSPSRVDAIKDIPTAKELGYNAIGANWRGFYMPKKVTDAQYKEWVDIVKTVSASKDWAELRTKNGLVEFASFGSDFDKFINQQLSDITDISKDLGLIQ